MSQEVLNGVGADGVGVKFPMFPVNCSYLPLVLVNVSDIFNFFLFGGGEGEVWGDQEGGGSVFIEIPKRGGGLPGGGCTRGPAGGLRQIGGGG